VRRVCSKCSDIKDWSCFSKGNGSHGLRRECKNCAKTDNAKWHETNRVSQNAKSAKWYADNVEEQAAYHRARYVADPQKFKDIGNSRYARDKDKLSAYYAARYAEDPERHKRLTRNWVERNRGKVAAISAKRRAAKLKATPPWADLDAIRAVYEEAAALGLEVDHIEPLQGKSVCGLHVPWNLQLLTKEANCRKSNKFEHQGG
jgi:hypothetical protein